MSSCYYSNGYRYCNGGYSSRSTTTTTSSVPVGLIISICVSLGMLVIFALISCYLRKKRMRRWAELQQRNRNARAQELSMQMEMQTQSAYADSSYANHSTYPMNTGAYPVASGGMYGGGYFQPNYAMPAYQQAQPSYPVYAQPQIATGYPIYPQPAIQTAALDPITEPTLAKVV